MGKDAKNPDRDKKGRFLPGNKAGISTESAREMQLLSADKRKENNTLAGVLRRTLQEKAASGSEMTKLEALVLKALDNHFKGKLTLKDLTYLQQLLGEAKLTLNHEGDKVIVVSQESVKAAEKWSSKE